MSQLMKIIRDKEREFADQQERAVAARKQAAAAHEASCVAGAEEYIQRLLEKSLNAVPANSLGRRSLVVSFSTYVAESDEYMFAARKRLADLFHQLAVRQLQEAGFTIVRSECIFRDARYPIEGESDRAGWCHMIEIRWS